MIEDNKRKTVIGNLEDAGCNQKQIEEYLRYMDEGCLKQQICLLSTHRKKLLEEIHCYQKKIDCLDYYLYHLKNRVHSEQCNSDKKNR